MQLMRVKDIFVSEDGFLILTGSLILANLREQSEIKKLFGTTIEIKNSNGGITIASIKDIAVSQALLGEIQICIAIDFVDNIKIDIGSIVYNHDS